MRDDVDAEPVERDAFHLPSPSTHPLIAAAGFTLIGFGILTSLAFSVGGLCVLAWGLAGWIREMLHE
jgi:hypothetical protein